MTERIAQAAIRHADGTVYTVAPPGRHHNVIKQMCDDGVWDREEERHVQGFTTDTGRFVGREEALAIALAAKQIIRRCGGDAFRLYSENLW